jgi:hypothetical protein
VSRKPRVQRTPEEKWQIVLEVLKSGKVSETCRSLPISITVGTTKWKPEPRLRLGGEAQPRSPMSSRRSGSSNWNGRWADHACRWRS